MNENQTTTEVVKTIGATGRWIRFEVYHNGERVIYESKFNMRNTPSLQWQSSALARMRIVAARYNPQFVERVVQLPLARQTN